MDSDNQEPIPKKYSPVPLVHGEYEGTDAEIAEILPKNRKPPYPKVVFLILVTEFCERFSFHGMNTILSIYLHKELGFSEPDTVVIYHVFSMACYFTPMFGAMISDSFLGKFRTIFFLSIVYVVGHVVHALAATPPVGLPKIPFSLVGLAMIALGTGGIKPCVAAFGGDQFLPEQQKQLVEFFSIFYFSINTGSLITAIVSPIFREDISCFGRDTCYSLAFAVPAGLMVLALVVFVAGRPFYRINKPTGNVILKVTKCVGKWKNSNVPRDHWMDYANDLYDTQFIEEVKCVLRVLLLFIPLPAFAALHGQQGSRWTLQATRMDGRVWDYTLKPDQIQVANPILTLLFIPIFDKILYPILGKCDLLKKPLQRMTTGGVLTGVAFVVAGIVELQIQKADSEGRLIHVLWLLPQYVILTAAEIMFALTGLEFAYSQSPVSMKSLMQSVWLLTIAFGNVIVIAVAKAQFFEKMYNEFFLFAGIMLMDMTVFAYLAWRYIPMHRSREIETS